MRRTALRRDDTGSAPVELVVLVTVSFMFIAAIVFAGRVNVGRAHTEAAARAAARTMTLARDPASATAAAEAEARRVVDEGSAMCTAMTFAAEVGPASVTVTVACTVDLSQAALVAVPGTVRVEASATEVIDRYRETVP